MIVIAENAGQAIRHVMQHLRERGALAVGKFSPSQPRGPQKVKGSMRWIGTGHWM